LDLPAPPEAARGGPETDCRHDGRRGFCSGRFTAPPARRRLSLHFLASMQIFVYCLQLEGAVSPQRPRFFHVSPTRPARAAPLPCHETRPFLPGTRRACTKGFLTLPSAGMSGPRPALRASENIWAIRPEAATTGIFASSRAPCAPTSYQSHRRGTGAAQARIVKIKYCAKIKFRVICLWILCNSLPTYHAESEMSL